VCVTIRQDSGGLQPYKGRRLREKSRESKGVLDPLSSSVPWSYVVRSVNTFPFVSTHLYGQIESVKIGI
jgi:hypothetical protein